MYSEQRERIDQGNRSDLQLIPMDGNLRTEDQPPFSASVLSFDEAGSTLRGLSFRLRPPRSDNNDAVADDIGRDHHLQAEEAAPAGQCRSLQVNDPGCSI
jgi:hypothetical protein